VLTLFLEPRLFHAFALPLVLPDPANGGLVSTPHRS
jgi:hypothetical protein